MAVDIKELIEKVVDELTSNKKLRSQFEENAVEVVEKLLKIDLPDEIIGQIVKGVKGKIAVDKVSDAVGMLKKLF